MFLKIFRNISCVRAARNNVATICHGRATSQDTKLPHNVSSFCRSLGSRHLSSRAAIGNSRAFPMAARDERGLEPRLVLPRPNR